MGGIFKNPPLMDGYGLTKGTYCRNADYSIPAVKALRRFFASRDKAAYRFCKQICIIKDLIPWIVYDCIFLLKVVLLYCRIM